MQLLEQPYVLDRDDRLVGKGLEECDLVVGEPAGLTAGHANRSDRLIVKQHRHHYKASVATDSSGGAQGFGQAGIGLVVGDIERDSIANMSSKEITRRLIEALNDNSKRRTGSIDWMPTLKDQQELLKLVSY